MYLGIDIGTTAAKALVVDEDGRVVAQGLAETPLSDDGAGRIEQDAEDAWRATAQACRKALADVDKEAVKTVSFSSAMHGFMVRDRAGRPLTRQFIWADGRAGDWAKRLRQETDAADLHRRTGCPVQPLYYPARLNWLRDEEPGLFRDAGLFSGVKEFILERLTGRRIMDRAMASATGLLNIHDLGWDERALEVAGIGPDRLPELVSPQTLIEGLDPERAAELGLSSSTALVPGAGDGGLANLGSGAVAPGQVAATIGTSGAMRLIVPAPLIDPHERTWCYHLTDGAWYAGGAINSGGIVYRWVRDGLYPDVVNLSREHGLDPYELINDDAALSPPGARGLVMLPYLMGERTPLWDPAARGAFLGLSRDHTRADLARAALEGSCLAMSMIHRALRESGARIDEVRVSGGFMRSKLWVKILADVLGEKIVIPASSEGSALGAVFLAMRARGRIKDLTEARDMIEVQGQVEPDADTHEFYDRLHQVFADLYPKVKDLYAELASLREAGQDLIKKDEQD